MTANIPSDAAEFFYQAYGGKRSLIYVWQRRSRWYWSALGNDGEEDSQLAAEEAAKRWIRGE